MATISEAYAKDRDYQRILRLRRALLSVGYHVDCRPADCEGAPHLRADVIAMRDVIAHQRPPC